MSGFFTCRPDLVWYPDGGTGNLEAGSLWAASDGDLVLPSVLVIRLPAVVGFGGTVGIADVADRVLVWDAAFSFLLSL